MASPATDRSATEGIATGSTATQATATSAQYALHVFTKHLGRFKSGIDDNKPPNVRFDGLDGVKQLDAVVQSGSLAVAEVPTVVFLKALLRFAGNDAAACDWILRQPSQKTASESEEPAAIEHVARLLFPRADLRSRATGLGDIASSLDRLRTSLFEAEPMLVLKVLLTKGVESQKLPADVTVSSAKFAAWLFGLLGSGDGDATNLDNQGLAAIAIRTLYGKMSSAGAAKFVPHYDSAVDLVKVMRSLCRIVLEADDVIILYGLKLHSIRRIAALPLDKFKKSILPVWERNEKKAAASEREQRAAAIHAAAQRADCWNEHAWLSAMEARRADFVPLEPPGLLPKSAEQSSLAPNAPPVLLETRRPVRNNNLTDIFLLEDAACESCCSITSLSAYFADLMSLLDRTSSKPGSPMTMLDVLHRRRPDLKHLELTCANAQTLIPYISLVNETLESYIRYKSIEPDDAETYSRLSIIPYNTSAAHASCDSEQGPPRYQTGNTDESVYTLISKQLHPFSAFPYNRPRNDASQILNIFQLPFHELIDSFRSPQLLLARLSTVHLQNPQIKQDFDRGCIELFARQSAAECLSLKQEDFAAITRETFWPSSFADLLHASKKPQSALTVQSAVDWSTAKLWGYSNLAAMTDTASGLGLTFIKKQLLPRSQLEFEDILDIIKSQCFNQDLVIVNKTGSDTFSNSLEDLRLLCNASQPPFTPLTDDICFRLQSFIRLKEKLKWSTKALDSAIYSLRRLELDDLLSSRAPKPASSSYFAISPFVLQGLAAIVKLSQLCYEEALDSSVDLLPLWGPIDTYGDNSLLYTRFLTPAMRTLSPIFARPQKGNQSYLMHETSYAALSDVQMQVCVALAWPLQSFPLLRKATGLEANTTELTLDTFTLLYRRVLLCRMLAVAPADCLRFSRVFFADLNATGGKHPLRDPPTTLAVVKSWKRLLDSGWTLDMLCAVLDTSAADAAPSNLQNAEGIQIVKALRQGAQDMRNSFPFLFTTAAPSEENVKDCAARTFEAATAGIVSNFVIDKQTITQPVLFDNVEIMNKAIAQSQNWPKKLTLVPDIGSSSAKADICLTGIPSPDDITGIRKLSIDVEPPLLQTAINQVLDDAIAPGKMIRKRFASNPDATTASGDLLTLLPISESPNSKATDNTELQKSDLDLQANIELYRIQRRKAFIRLCSPLIVQDLLQMLISNTVKIAVPDLDASLLPILLSRIVSIPKLVGVGSETALVALQSFSGQDVEDSRLDAYFTPGSTDIYSLSYTGPEAEPTLSINGIRVPFDKDKDVWTPLPMTGGQNYRITANLPASHLRWATSKSMPSSFTAGMLLAADRVKRANTVIEAVRRAALICQNVSLSPDELQYFTSPQLPAQPAILQVNFSAPSLFHLVQLDQYREVREGTSNGRLIGLFQWLTQSTAADISQVASHIYEATGWSRRRLEELLRAKYEDSSVTAEQVQTSLVTNLSDFDALWRLHCAMKIDKRMLSACANADSLPPMSTLVDLAQPRFELGGIALDTVAVRALRARLSAGQTSAADSHAMEDQRNALVAYLLQQQYVRDMHIADADGLLQHFLIDVQMGPTLQTSRIKQAVSVVQLFAQRSLLGLEDDVAKRSLVREQWEWRQQYSLWEAHVKLFLYPENWLEPTIRDDKSQLFDEFEASLMNKDLSMGTFLTAIKTYIYGLNEISSLEVVAYLHEPAAGHGASDKFHFFGCTRASPRVFYHRTLTVVQGYTAKSDGDVEQRIESTVWRPWKKIEMDIPVIETEWDGGRLPVTGSHVVPVLTQGRLYLFMPQIVPKSIKDDGADSKNFGEMSTTNPNATKPKRAWEISMTWTELVLDVWSPKRVSSQSLALVTKGVSAAPLPSPNAFQFDPRYDTVDKTNAVVTILVNYPSDSDLKSYSNLGGFRFCDDQIVALENVAEFRLSKRWAVTNGTDSKLLSNSFQQLRLPDGVNIFSSQALAATFPNEKATVPLLWIPKALKDVDDTLTDGRKSNSIAWTVSASRSSAINAFILSSQRLNGTSVSYFTLPKTDLTTLRAYRDKILAGTGSDPSTNFNNSTDLVVMDHQFAHELMQAAVGKADPLRDIFDVLGRYKTGDLAKSTFGKIEWTSKTEKQDATEVELTHMAYHELALPAAIYNWEAFMHTVLLAMDRFHATQQFDEALEVARLVFDPTAEVTVAADSAQSCWKFPPFQDIARELQVREKGLNLKLASLADDAGFSLAVMERRSHGALVHATARGRPEAYMKWIVIKYAETLIAAGDAHFRKGTLESLPLAIQRYIEASHILGPLPAKIPKLGQRKKPKTFATLAGEDEKLELELPFSRTLMAKKLADDSTRTAAPKEVDAKRENMVCYLRTTYFCVPLNPKYKEMRSLVNERLFNIRNALDIQGRPVTYALLEPPIDPAALIALSQSGGRSVSDVIAMLTSDDRDGPLPRQRFEVLLHRAQELCQELRGLGERLLGAIEKRDNETFSAARARHATAIRRMTLDLKRSHLTEAEATVESLLLNRDSQISQLKFYLDLIGEPHSLIPSPKDAWADIGQDIDRPSKDDLRMSSYERMEMNMADAAGLLNLVAAGIDGLVAPLCAIPEVEANGAPLGVGASVTVGGQAVSKAVAAGSAYIKMLAMMAGDKGGRASRKAQLTRQLQDRRLQANMRGREIKSIDKQIEIQRLRISAAVREIDIEEAEIADASQVEMWYKTKYTNAQLYSWMEKQLRGLYYQAYTLAMSTARRAESALSFEHGTPVSVLRSAGYFANGHDGLLAADYLSIDLKRLEAAYHETRSHDFELSKTVSLRQLDPFALLTLRLTGSTTFSFGENLFDLDFPGHYMRRLRSVAVSIPAVIGPHSGINATLRLTDHRYRVSPNTLSSKDYAAGPKNRSAFRTDHIPISSVAISSGSHDSGVFELSFTGAKYAPFEGAGAISTWRLDLPVEVRKFDYKSISDVIFHVQYTANDGGAMLRTAARDAVLSRIKDIKDEGRDQGFWAALDLKNDFANEWYSFSNKVKTSTEDVLFDLGLIRDRLPFWARQQPKLVVRGLTWVSKNGAMVKALGMVGVDAPQNKEDVLQDTLNTSTVKRWRSIKTQATITGTTRWQVKFKASDMSKGEDLSTVYMLIHYVFA